MGNSLRYITRSTVNERPKLDINMIISLWCIYWKAIPDWDVPNEIGIWLRRIFRNIFQFGIHLALRWIESPIPNWNFLIGMSHPPIQFQNRTDSGMGCNIYTKVLFTGMNFKKEAGLYLGIMLRLTMVEFLKTLAQRRESHWIKMIRSELFFLRRLMLS